MRALTRTLNAVQRLMEHTEEVPDLDETEAEQTEAVQPTAPLHLIGIVSGSAMYNVAAEDPERALKTLSETGISLGNPERSQWGDELLSPVERLSDVARSLGCEIEFRRPGKDGDILATITPQSYEMLSATAFVNGESSICGYLERVGGATERRCGLRLPNQPAKMVFCPVQTVELVRQLGQHIYRNVIVSGTVTWFRRTWKVKSVLVKSFEPAKEGSILEALGHIYEAGGKAWDDVEDADKLIAEIRGG
jgi:hypothetical protein